MGAGGVSASFRRANFGPAGLASEKGGRRTDYAAALDLSAKTFTQFRPPCLAA